MTTHDTNEKKPAEAGGCNVKLLDFDALIFRRCGRDGFSVSTLGAVYTESPRCCDVSAAAIEWAKSCPEAIVAIDAALDRGSEAEGITHILAFMDAMASSYWQHYRPASVVEVPGLGCWEFQASTEGGKN